MKEKNLSDLVSELQAGNQSVFEDIYYQTQQKLYFYAMSIMKNENDAKDLLQETYVEIMKSIKNLQSIDKFIPWAKKILFHLAMQKFRKGDSAVILDEEYESLIENFEETDDSSVPEEAYDISEVKAIIRGIVEDLPMVQKLSIIAYYYDEMNIRDIAEMMECSENTVKTRLHYGRLAMKDKLVNYEEKHNIRLHALTPLLLLSMKGYDEVYAMSADSAGALVDRIIKPADQLRNLSSDPLTEAAQITAAEATAKVAETSVKATIGAAVKAAGSIGVSKLIAVIAVVVIGISGIGFAHAVNTPEKTLENFEKSFNKGDLDGVLDCVDPEAKTLYKGISGLASSVVGTNVDELLSSMFGLAAGVEHDGRFSIDIVVKSVETNEDEAYAEVYMILYRGKSLYDSSFEKVMLKKIDGQWYIME